MKKSKKCNCICTYEEANIKFFNYCRRHGIRNRPFFYSKKYDPDIIHYQTIEFYKNKKSVKILPETLDGDYAPYLGPAGHLQLMKDFVYELI